MKRMLATFGVALLVLSGCAVVQPSAAPSGGTLPSSSDPAAPTSTPSPTPTASTQPLLAQLVLEPGGLGPLRIGYAVPSSSPAEAALVTWNAHHCGDDTADFGTWDAAYPVDPAQAFGSAPFAVGTADFAMNGPVEAIQTFSSQLHTATGVHVGSTVAELKAAYPDGFAATSHGLYTDSYAVDGPGGRLIFEVYDGSAEAEGLDTVAVITSTESQIAPFTLIPGDSYVGSCA